MQILALTPVLGLNTTVSIKAHRGTFPSLPHIGEGLSKLELGFQIPKVPVPRSPERRPGDDGPHFVQSTTYAFLSALKIWS